MLDIRDHYRRGIPSRKPDCGQASCPHAIVIRQAQPGPGSRRARWRAGLLADRGRGRRGDRWRGLRGDFQL